MEGFLKGLKFGAKVLFFIVLMKYILKNKTTNQRILVIIIRGFVA